MNECPIQIYGDGECCPDVNGSMWGHFKGLIPNTHPVRRWAYSHDVMYTMITATTISRSFIATHESLESSWPTDRWLIQWIWFDPMMMMWCSRPTLTKTSPPLVLFAPVCFVLPQPTCMFATIINPQPNQGFMRSSQNHNIQNTSSQRKKKESCTQKSCLLCCMYVLLCFDLTYTCSPGTYVSLHHLPLVVYLFCSLELIYCCCCVLSAVLARAELYELEWIRLEFCVGALGTRALHCWDW